MKQFTNHLKRAHQLSAIDYTIQFIHGGIRPRCRECGNETRYVSLLFKTYCKFHANIAMSEGSKSIPSEKRCWSKGLTKDDHPGLAKLSRRHSGENNPFHGKKHSPELQQRINDKNRLSFDEVLQRIESMQLQITVLSTASDYTHRQRSKLRIKCNQCETEDNVTLTNIERCWNCRNCKPIGSRQQIDIAKWISCEFNVDVKISNRIVIHPLELDIWIPERSVAIEYHGLYWHSGGRNSDSFDTEKHAQKQTACESANIHLIQFFSDEWNNHKRLCESLIRNALSTPTNQVNFDDCNVVVSTSRIQDDPLGRWVDFQGNQISFYDHNDKLLLTWFYRIENGDLEVIESFRRYDVIVIDGTERIISRLLQMHRNIGIRAIRTTIDRRLQSAIPWLSVGFVEIESIAPRSWWTNGKKRTVCKQNNDDRLIWDAGSIVLARMIT